MHLLKSYIWNTKCYVPRRAYGTLHMLHDKVYFGAGPVSQPDCRCRAAVPPRYWGEVVNLSEWQGMTSRNSYGVPYCPIFMDLTQIQLTYIKRYLWVWINVSECFFNMWSQRNGTAVLDLLHQTILRSRILQLSNSTNNTAPRVHVLESKQENWCRQFAACPDIPAKTTTLECTLAGHVWCSTIWCFWMATNFSTPGPHHLKPLTALTVRIFTTPILRIRRFFCAKRNSNVWGISLPWLTLRGKLGCRGTTVV